MKNKLIDEQNPNYTIPLNEFSMEEIPEEKFFRIVSRLFSFHHSPIFQLRHIALDQICPLTRYVYDHRLAKANSLINIYKCHGIPLFKPVCLIHQTAKVQIVCPPIMEIHSSRYVLCDGTHRVYQAKHLSLKSIMVLIVKNTVLPLPGDINNWQHVQALKEEVSVEKNFINFKKENLTGYTWVFNGEKCWMDYETYASI